MPPTENKPLFRYVGPDGTPIADTLDRAHPRNEFDTPKILDDETHRQAFDAWKSTRNDVANKWNHLADKTNLKPRSHQPSPEPPTSFAPTC